MNSIVIKYRGQTILTSKSALQKHLQRMKEYADFAKRLKEKQNKEETK